MTLTTYSSAIDMRAALDRKEISARELLALHRERIDAVNGEVNALVSIDFDKAEAAAAAADDAAAHGRSLGALHGLPFGFKDTVDVAGWRSTHGSPVMADHVPEADDLLAERVRGAGAVTVAKTNAPEWAAGSHTFNPIFGTTYNPYDLSRSAGGSSGGAAAALASGMLPLADGSDMGGSLRNPASFNNVVGFRPSPGRVPTWPNSTPWDRLAVQGPMARSVDDLALLLSVIAGPTDRTTMSLSTAGSTFARIEQTPLAGLRVAFSADLNGALALDPAVRAVTAAGRDVFSTAGADVQDAAPDLSGADDAFTTLRAWQFQMNLGPMLARHPDQFKATLAENIRDGEALTGHDVARAMGEQAAIYQRIWRFFERFDVLVMPVSQVPPFDAGQEYPETIDGATMTSYLDWMRSAYFITVTGCPAISMPAGFTPEGWPVGVQIVGPPNRDLKLLGIAKAFEALNPAGARRPELDRMR
ncbi:amidase [Spelaeicoccus albus]|uniref:Amidase n=1 Tax=Spelaeicoccus albus TaxID=1280376 RepID=A0A7Z0D1I0_9MICO|nr:amidase [Spelaeicoccus albus]NYI66297.1 amidase [Spelaeicoccus albus]